ncbi:hypothetical protein AJ79_10285 [Helicocarpus griseus UAMH5409]|uniref:C2H2-type domain-containing protein n=1 Tax=Helicocarpus griseus UAMH5409 TaxID=1447875 RepID=A0A2B7WER1_9EURO|nr:hypothetical protein AJ79_10285 [Helicocarpus griseus UAMH5409]
MTSSLAPRIIAVEGVSPHRYPSLHDRGLQNNLFMAGPVQPSSDPITFSRTLNPILSSSSSIAATPGPISFLKSAEPRGGSSLSSIASAGLRTSPSPIMATNSRLSPQPATAGNSDRGRDGSREGASSQQISKQNTRDTRSPGPDERRDKPQEGSTTVATRTSASTDAADGVPKSIQITSDDPRTDNRARRASPMGMSDGFDAGDNMGNTTTLINSSTVASPGPIEEPNPMESERLRRREEDIMMEESNKAFSYPVPMPASNMTDMRRGMSLPHSGFNKGGPRSPSAKKHRCHHCATEFTRHHNLKSHLLTHSQEKPYVCSTCQSRFRRLHDLKRHTKLHTGERPHICPKCGRRFARGDALARHNKGQGGCAGRRSSLGSFLGDEEYGDGGGPGGEDGMEGLMYTEPDRMDEEEEKRMNMPSIKKHNPPDSLQRTSSTGHVTFQSHQSSTYPPLATHRPSQGSLFPPVTSHPGSSSSASPISQSGNMPFPAGGSGSSSNLNAQQQGGQSSVFAQNNMTESPKPLSPNVMPTRQLSHGPDPNVQHSRGLSPTLKPQYPQPQQQFGRNGAPGSNNGPTQILPAPQPGAPQLPPPHGMNPDARFPLHSPNASQAQGQIHSMSASGAPHLQHHSHSNSGSTDLNNHLNNSNNNIFSQQRQLSTSSHSGAQPPDRIWAIIRALEDRVNGLEDEVGRLRSQLAVSGGAGNSTNGA